MKRGATAMKHVGDLEIDENIRFQEGEWRLERVSWLVGFAIVLLGLIGLFGTGPISGVTAGDPTGEVTVRYQRFVRYDGTTTLDFSIANDRIRDGKIEVWLSAAYLDKVEIEQFSQEPDQVRNEGDRIVFVFLAENRGQPLSFTISMRSQGLGRLHGEVGMLNGPQVSINQFSYP